MNGDAKAKKNLRERIRRRQLRLQRFWETHRKRQEKKIAEKKKSALRRKAVMMTIALLIASAGIYGIWRYASAPAEQPNGGNTPAVDSEPFNTYNYIIIFSNGTVIPRTAPITLEEDNVYKLNSDVTLPIIVGRDNIIIDGQGHMLRGGGVYGSRGIDLTDRCNVIVRNLTITGFDYGVYMLSSSNVVLEKCNLTGNYCGVWLSYATNNTLHLNSFIKNDFYGIFIKESSGNRILRNEAIAHYNYTIYMKSSRNNTIAGNALANNSLAVFLYLSDDNFVAGNLLVNNRQGIHITESKANVITRNHIEGNIEGLGISEANSNVIYLNNFLNNTSHVNVMNSTNVWDYDGKGNYWDDYSQRYPDAVEMDGLGVWDTPYMINKDNVDRYPLLNQVKIDKYPY